MAERWESERHSCIGRVSVGNLKLINAGGIGGICVMGSGNAETLNVSLSGIM